MSTTISISKFDIALSILALAKKPLHANQDLNYMIEVVRNEKSEGKPWYTLGGILSQKKDKGLVKQTEAMKGHWELDLSSSDGSLEKFIADKLGNDKFDKIKGMVKESGFLNENGELVFMVQNPFSIKTPKWQYLLFYHNSFLLSIR